MKKTIFLLILAVILFTTLKNINATTVYFIPDNITNGTDANLYSGGPNTNYGNGAYNCYGRGDADSQRIVYNWTYILDYIPADSTITGFWYNAKIGEGYASTGSSVWNVYPINCSWRESNVTWNNFSSPAAACYNNTYNLSVSKTSPWTVGSWVNYTLNATFANTQFGKTKPNRKFEVIFIGNEVSTTASVCPLGSDAPIGTQGIIYLNYTPLSTHTLYYSLNSTNNTIVNKPTQFSVFWNSSITLSNYIFGWSNGTNWTSNITTNDTESNSPSYQGTNNTLAPAIYNESFEDQSLGRWTEAGEGDWVVETAASGIVENGTYVAHSDDCDSYCTLTSRQIDLTNYDEVYLTFQWGITGLDAGETLNLSLYNGTVWKNTWTTAPQVSANGHKEINLAMSNNSDYRISNFQMLFGSKVSATNEYAEFDNVTITARQYKNNNFTDKQYTVSITETVYTFLDDLSVTINVTYYNTSSSITNNNTNATLWLDAYNGTSWVSIGAININNTGLFNKTITNSELLSSWSESANRKINLTPAFLDYPYDNITWNNLWFNIDSHQELLNDSAVSFSGGTANWSNITKTISSTQGDIIKWIVYAYDTSNNWNNTGIMQFITTASSDLQSPVITQNSPADSLHTTNNFTSFNCTVTDDSKVKNISLWLTNNLNTSYSYNYTNTSNMLVNTLNVSYTLQTGNYTWNCQACDILENCGFSNNRTLEIQPLAGNSCSCVNGATWNVNLADNCELKTDCITIPYETTCYGTGNLGIYANLYTRNFSCTIGSYYLNKSGVIWIIKP